MEDKLRQIELKWKGKKPNKGTTEYIMYKIDRMKYREIKRNGDLVETAREIFKI